MKKLLIVIAALALVGYAALGINNIVSRQQKLELNEVKLKSTTSELQDLQLKYNRLNGNLEKELHNNNTDQQKVKQLESEKQDLQKQKEDLEKQLQARLQQKAADKARADQLASKAVNTLTGTATAAADSPTGDKYSLMAAAGIAASEYEAMDYIVSHEGSWSGTTRYNTAGSGAYGLCQALPASKMASAGADYMTNPVTQLRWCASYASGRYGGLWGAYNFWINNKWW